MYTDSISQNINNIEAITHYSTLHRDENFNTNSVSIKDIIKINDNKSIEIILCPHVSSIFRSSISTNNNIMKNNLNKTTPSEVCGECYYNKLYLISQ